MITTIHDASLVKPHGPIMIYGPAPLPRPIRRISDVLRFFNDLHAHGVSFHPEDTMQEDEFGIERVARVNDWNETMEQCRKVCALLDQERSGFDINSVALISLYEHERIPLWSGLGLFYTVASHVMDTVPSS